MKVFALLLLFCGPLCSFALYEDQALKFDWRQRYVGSIEDAALFKASKSKDILVVRTKSNVLAALDGDSGKIHWRHTLAVDETLLDIVQEDSKHVTSLSYGDVENVTFVRTWNALHGALTSEKRFQTQIKDQNIDQGFLFDGKPHLVHKTVHNGLKIHAIHDNDEKTSHSFSTGAGEDKDGFSCLALIDSYVCISALLSSVYSTKLPLNGNSMNMASLTTLGVTESPQKGVSIKRLTDSEIAVQLTSGSIAVLKFKDGKFVSINTLKKTASGTGVLYAIKCANDASRPLLLEQICQEKDCQTSVTLTRGSNQHTYETSGDRGLINHGWMFCDADDKDAFQLILGHEDGSIVSVTPLGNVMWEREEGLGSLNVVKLIAKSSIDDDYESTETSHEHVTEMFLKRLKHHLSQLHMFVERIKSGKVGLSTLLLGNPDVSYDDFGMRKIILALTHHGSLYALDSKTGKILWHRMTICQGSSFLHLQRDHFAGLKPLAALLCSDQVIKFDPLNGQIQETKVLKEKIIKATLLHHANPEDLLRPILIQTESNGFLLEPLDAGKHLNEISGKMFIATIDADKMGIHGYQLTIDGHQNVVEKIPVWSFSSSGAKILHLLAKPTEEVVHSQGRVMADRSVLFKYINPNLAFIIAEGQDTSGKGFINIFLLDLVTGRTLFSANHKRVQGPYHAVHSENWVVYTYYNEKSRRAELGSLELFEGKTQSNATTFSSLHNNIAPLVERQAYILSASYINALQDTVTEKGITTKNILMATASGSVYNVPRQFLDPRRPNVNTPPEMREPGLPPYVPELVFPPEVILNYNQSLTRVKGIVTAATGLESTSVVFVHGLDLFCSLVTPSKGFDLLKDDFEHYVIASVLAGLIAAAFITRKLSQRKMLMSAWK